MEYFLSLFGLALITSVLLLQSVVFGQFNHNSLENGNDDDEIGLRIFGFEESVDNCSKIPKTRKEKMIGITYNLLCRHFGPKSRDKILKSIEFSKKVIPVKRMKHVFTTCLNRMKSKIMACFATIFDDYDLAGNENPPHCLRNLAIYPDKRFQIFWLKKFPIILEYINRVIKGYKMFNPSRVIVKKFLEQGVMHRWKRVPHFDYAKMKIKQWMGLGFMHKKSRLKAAIGESSNLLNICTFSMSWLRKPHDFMNNSCLRKILGNLLVLETYFQSKGCTLESEFIFGRYLLLHLLHIVKSVMRSCDLMNSRRSMNNVPSPVSNAVAQLNDVKAMNVKCLDNLRRSYDQTGGGKLSNILKTHDMQECLDTVVNNTEAAGEIVKKTFLKQVHAPVNDNFKTAEKSLIRSVMRSHRRMKPLQPIIQEMIEKGVPNPSPTYPWADKFLNKFKTSTIANDHAKLENAHVSTSYSSSTSCKKNKANGSGRRGNCWSNYVTQNMIIENELQKTGLTMQEMYLGDPARMNMIYYIDEGLKKNRQNVGRIVAQYRRSLIDSEDIEPILEKLLDDSLDEIPPIFDPIEDDQLSRRSSGALIPLTPCQDDIVENRILYEDFNRCFYRISYALVRGALDPTVGVIVPSDKTMVGLLHLFVQMMTSKPVTIYCIMYFDFKGEFLSGFCVDSETEDYLDSSKPSTSTQIDPTDDYDQYEIKEFESITKKTYHCAARLPMMKNSSKPDNKVMELLDDNGITSIRSKKHHYQVRNVRQKMCQAGFNVFQINNKAGSIHKRFKNTIRLMIYNTPGIFPGLKVIRSDLDRKRRREPQVWFKFELSGNPLSAEFDYDNYFITVSGDFGRIQAYSKMLVAVKMHKHLNNFNDSVSYKINIDLGIMEIILANFGVALMKDKATTNLMVKALNGIRTELNNDGEVQVEFEESMKDAVDQVDPLLYSSIWLQSMAEKYEVVKMKEKSKTNGNPSQKSARGR